MYKLYLFSTKIIFIDTSINRFSYLTWLIIWMLNDHTFLKLIIFYRKIFNTTWMPKNYIDVRFILNYKVKCRNKNNFSLLNTNYFLNNQNSNYNLIYKKNKNFLLIRFQIWICACINVWINNICQNTFFIYYLCWFSKNFYQNFLKLKALNSRKQLNLCFFVKNNKFL